MRLSDRKRYMNESYWCKKLLAERLKKSGKKWSKIYLVQKTTKKKKTDAVTWITKYNENQQRNDLRTLIIPNVCHIPCGFATVWKTC